MIDTSTNNVYTDGRSKLEYLVSMTFIEDQSKILYDSDSETHGTLEKTGIEKRQYENRKRDDGFGSLSRGETATLNNLNQFSPQDFIDGNGKLEWQDDYEGYTHYVSLSVPHAALAPQLEPTIIKMVNTFNRILQLSGREQQYFCGKLNAALKCTIY